MMIVLFRVVDRVTSLVMPMNKEVRSLINLSDFCEKNKKNGNLCHRQWKVQPPPTPNLRHKGSNVPTLKDVK